jgi:hypothetical protein
VEQKKPKRITVPADSELKVRLETLGIQEFEDATSEQTLRDVEC